MTVSRDLVAQEDPIEAMVLGAAALRQSAVGFLPVGPEALQAWLQPLEPRDVDIGAGLNEPLGGFACDVEDSCIETLIQPAEFGQAALTCPKEIAGAAELEVPFGEHETIVRGNHCLQTGTAIHGDLIGKEKTVTLACATTDASAELVQLS